MENPVNLKVPREEAEKLIRSYIKKGQEIKDMNILSEEDLTQAHSRRKSWKSVTTDFLESIFTNGKFTKEFNRPFSGMVYTGMSPLERRAGQFESWIQEDIDYLSTLIDRLQFIPSLDKKIIQKLIRKVMIQFL